MGLGMGGHHSAVMKKDEWLTPPEIVSSLGDFDLDPCSPINRPWETAKTYYTILDDGLSKGWNGRVWMNPPYGKETEKWMGKLSEHGNGIALIFARTETKMFFSHVWDKADAVLFVKGRITFYNVDGTKPKGNGGAPSVLIAYGKNNVESLRKIKHTGKFIELHKEGN